MQIYGDQTGKAQNDPIVYTFYHMIVLKKLGFFKE